MPKAPPVKKQSGKIRRFSRSANYKISFPLRMRRAKRSAFKIVCPPPLPRSGTSFARRRHFSGVENCIFPRLFHTEKRQRPGVENLGPAIPDWRKINCRSGTVCRMQRKSFDFLFYKRQNACIFIQNFPESGCLNYGAYRAEPFLLLKTQWKKWKTLRKTQPFLHKSG